MIHRSPGWAAAILGSPSAGLAPLSEVCIRAFESVAEDKEGLVVCEGAAGKTRVDWGICDTVRKAGKCLMPPSLRWRAARDLEALFRANA